MDIPKNSVKKLYSHYIKPGAVLKCFFPDVNKIKRFVIIELSADKKTAAIFLINTRNPFKGTGNKSEAFQMPLEARGRDYLDHDSYLSCSSIYEKSVQWLEDQIKKHPKSYMNEMDKEDHGLAKRTIANSGLLSGKQLKRYNLRKYVR